MIAEIVFMAVTVTLLAYIAYTQHKAYILNELTLVSLLAYLENIEEEQNFGKEKFIQ